MRARRFAPMILASTLLVAAALAGSQLLSVQVRSARVRATQSQLGATVAQMEYGARVELLLDKGDWKQVRTDAGKVGWVHSSALSKKKILLQSGTETAGTHASVEEIALAGKGFNPEVEAEYRASDPKANFAAVDRMESAKASPEEVVAFLKAGGIDVPEGGAR